MCSVRIDHATPSHSFPISPSRPVFFLHNRTLNQAFSDPDLHTSRNCELVFAKDVSIYKCIRGLRSPS